jgi:hypothetical protein
MTLIIQHGEETTLAPVESGVRHHDRDTQRQQNEAARKLLQTWLSDTSGYDEEMWPHVQPLIEDTHLSLRNTGD